MQTKDDNVTREDINSESESKNVDMNESTETNRKKDDNSDEKKSNVHDEKNKEDERRKSKMLDRPLNSSRYKKAKPVESNEKVKCVVPKDDGPNHPDTSTRKKHYSSESRKESNPKRSKTLTKSSIDNKLPSIVQPDPRGSTPHNRITTKASNRGKGRNTESFDPKSTLVRPDLRIKIGSNDLSAYNEKLKHDDVLIVPELFGRQDDWSTYYKLIEEISDIQNKKEHSHGNHNNNSKTNWISWHEGAHLIIQDPTSSPTFQSIIDRLCTYFHIRKQSIGTRFNWYRDSSDWKPFHHDSAAFNPQRAKNQNITVGVSFGATRELAFIRAYDNDHHNPEEKDDSPGPMEQEEKEPQHHVNRKKVRLYFPQTNNGVFSFGRDVNILWKHGINGLPPEEQDGKGRVSIILWGLAQNVVEEPYSPPLLGSNGKGPHANKNNHSSGGGGRRRRRHPSHRDDLDPYRRDRHYDRDSRGPSRNHVSPPRTDGRVHHSRERERDRDRDYEEGRNRRDEPNWYPKDDYDGRRFDRRHRSRDNGRRDDSNQMGPRAFGRDRGPREYNRDGRR